MSEIFGETARKHFYLEDGTAFTNHGSYGTVPVKVMKERFRLLELIENHPDRWFRSSLRPLYEESRLAVAEFVGADPRNLVFVSNATTAVNIVVKQLQLEAEDMILCTSHTYNACYNAVDCAVRRVGADIISIDISLPIRSEQEIVDLVTETCQRHVGVRLAVIDHISSPSALLFPVKQIASELHKLGVMVLIDGAHAPGQVELNLEDIGADFYTGNLHKWCFAPKGCAFLWVSSKHRDSLEPLVTSHLYKQDLQDQFFMQGTMDHTPFLCAKAGLEFYKDFGGISSLTDYTEPVLDFAQQLISHSLQTSVLPVPTSMVAPFMRVLKLPSNEKYPVCRDTAEKLMTEMAVDSGVVPVIVSFSGHLWLRISANMYTTKDDFYRLRDVIVKKFFTKK